MNEEIKIEELETNSITRSVQYMLGNVNVHITKSEENEAN